MTDVNISIFGSKHVIVDGVEFFCVHSTRVTEEGKEKERIQFFVSSGLTELKGYKLFGSGLRQDPESWKSVVTILEVDERYLEFGKSTPDFLKNVKTAYDELGSLSKKVFSSAFPDLADSNKFRYELYRMFPCWKSL